MLSKFPFLFTSILFICCAVAHASQQVPALPKETQIEFPSELDGVLLKATLTIPAKRPQTPILMIAGSGKVDRDGTLPASVTSTGKPEKLFQAIAEILNEESFTTLRYDKRGVIYEKVGEVDEKIWATADREHLIADAVSAARFLLKETNTQPEDLIILGHSEGTILAVETAIALGGEVRGLILLGAQARDMKSMLRYQVVESRSVYTDSTVTVQKQEAKLVEIENMLQTSTDAFAPDGKPMAWYRQYFAAPSNAERIKIVKAQVVVFQGAIDPQTPVGEVDALKEAVPNLTSRIYPLLGHGFSPDKDGKPTIGPIDPYVLEDIAAEARRISKRGFTRLRDGATK